MSNTLLVSEECSTHCGETYLESTRKHDDEDWRGSHVAEGDRRCTTSLLPRRLHRDPSPRNPATVFRHVLASRRCLILFSRLRAINDELSVSSRKKSKIKGQRVHTALPVLLKVSHYHKTS